jgi:hypothetical protein
MENDEVKAAALRAAAAQLRLKSMRRRLLELQQGVTAFRNEQLWPAETEARESMAALDRAMGLESPREQWRAQA